jgi:uncharacterized protein (TIGR03437 family)
VIRSAALLPLLATLTSAAGTTVTLQSSGSPSFLGPAVSLTATVTPSTATGAVYFYDGVTAFGGGSLSGGKVVLATFALGPGVHSLTARYRGDGVNAPAASPVLSQVVLGLGQKGFQPAVPYGGVAFPREAASGDFNGDGKMDLVAANFASNTVAVALGKGDGTFQPPVTYQADPSQASGPSGIQVADFNGDGRLDIAVANGATAVSSVAVFLGNGDGTFQKAISNPVQGNPHTLAVADFNGDGIPDLVADNYLYQSLAVLLGKGDGTFQPAITVPTPPNPIYLTAGDFNGDGAADLAVVASQNQVSILLGKGDGTFRSAATYPVGSALGKVAVADLNGDGRLDLILAGTGDNNVSILLGKGDGSFQSAVNYPAGEGPVTLAVGDFNGDSLPDIAVTNTRGNNVSLLLGNGDGTFQPAANYGVGTDPLALAAADFNGDGRTDLAVGNYIDGSLSILLGSPIAEPIISLVQNGASFQNGLAANSWMTIKGANLASVTDTWDNAIVNGRLPTTLDGVSVSVGGVPAYVYFVSPGQINAVAPAIPAGKVSVVVTNSQGSSPPFASTAQTYMPAFFLWNNTYSVATRQDFTLAAKNGTFAGASTVAAKPGDVIILWGTGFGPTSPAAPAGVQLPASAFPTASPVTVTVGTQAATVYGAALAPGFAGLYQIAIEIPTSLSDGDYPVVAAVAGFSSPVTAIISVQR